ERIDRTEVCAARPRGHREAKHEVRRIEEEEDEEEHELVLVPLPPVSPAVARPDRSGHERQRSEDHSLVNRDVAFEVGVLVTLPEDAQRLPPTPGEARIRRQGDADVEIE